MDKPDTQGEPLTRKGNTVSLSPSKNPTYRAATRLLTMVHELHKAGYQRIRIHSGMAPSGVHWRCVITHAGNLTPDGMKILDYTPGDQVASYSTGGLDRYFEWGDAPGRSARELAALFLHRFPRIAQDGAGRDWAYAGWLTEILGRAERDELAGFPVFFADYPLEHDPVELPPPPERAAAA